MQILTILLSPTHLRNKLKWFCLKLSLCMENINIDIMFYLHFTLLTIQYKNSLGMYQYHLVKPAVFEIIKYIYMFHMDKGSAS